MKRRPGTVEMHQGRWRVRLRLPDGTRRPFQCPPTTSSREEAEAFRDALLLELGGTANDPTLTGSTLGAWASRWLDAREKTHRDAAGDRQRWDGYWRDDPIAAVSMRALAPSALLDAGTRLVKRDLARQTTRNAWTTLRSCLSAAVHARELSADRAAALLTTQLPPLSVERSTDTEEKWHMLSEQEIGRVLALELRPDARSAFLMGIFTGMRAGELQALRWSDVHLDGPAPHVVVARSRSTATKSGKVGRVRLIAPAVEALRDYAAAIGANVSSGALLWPSTHGGMHARGYDWGWADSSKGGAGIRTRARVRPEVTWHDATRHTCASHLHMGTWVKNGWLDRALRLEEVKVWLRHSSIEVTQRYAHLSLDSLPVSLGPYPSGPSGPYNPSKPKPPPRIELGTYGLRNRDGGPVLFAVSGNRTQTGPDHASSRGVARDLLMALADADAVAVEQLAMRLAKLVLDEAEPAKAGRPTG